jgi:CheY-like chemotaxis protein
VLFRSPSILVTAFDQPHMWQQARQAQVDATLVKPITASSLHDALVRVIRRHVPAAPPAGMGAGKAEQALLRHHAGQRVLLAEDNLINREVAGELLRSAGLVVETANDGRRAVELATSRRYDLVLMDVQMPELDGLAATQLIRQALGQALPIVAMTANAFGEDRAACLAAGMNDHVAKPVDPELLYATLLRWLPLTAPTASADGDEALSPEPALLYDRLAAIAGFDVGQALRNVGGQMPALERILASFARNYRDGEPAFAATPGEDDRPHWKAACHSLRGVCATVGATALLAELTALEPALRGAPLPGLAPLAQRIHESLMQLAHQLQTELDR